MARRAARSFAQRADYSPDTTARWTTVFIPDNASIGRHTGTGWHQAPIRAAIERSPPFNRPLHPLRPRRDHCVKRPSQRALAVDPLDADWQRAGRLLTGTRKRDPLSHNQARPYVEELFGFHHSQIARVESGQLSDMRGHDARDHSDQVWLRDLVLVVHSETLTSYHFRLGEDSPPRCVVCQGRNSCPSP